MNDFGGPTIWKTPKSIDDKQFPVSDVRNPLDAEMHDVADDMVQCEFTHLIKFVCWSNLEFAKCAVSWSIKNDLKFSVGIGLCNFWSLFCSGNLAGKVEECFVMTGGTKAFMSGRENHRGVAIALSKSFLPKIRDVSFHPYSSHMWSAHVCTIWWFTFPLLCLLLSHFVRFWRQHGPNVWHSQFVVTCMRVT